MPESIQIILGIVGALGSISALILYFANLRANRRKEEAEAGLAEATVDQKTLENVDRVVRIMRDELERLKTCIDEQDDRLLTIESRMKRYLLRIEYLMTGIKVLLYQLEREKINPDWVPGDWDLYGNYQEPPTQPKE